MKVKGILLDLDGTLVNTNNVIINCYNYACEKVYGHTFPLEDFVHYFGIPLADGLNALFPDKGAEVLAAYKAFQDQHHDELIREFPGVIATLKALQDRGIKLAIVTSKHKEAALRGLNCFDMAKYFEAIVDSKGVAHSKPSPEPSLKALELLGLQGDECLCVGDSPYDLQSGHGAGCTTVAVDYSIFDKAKLIGEGKPDYVIKAMPELLDLIARLEQEA